MRKHDLCPACGQDIRHMDAQAFADHMHEEHPEMWEVFRRVFASFGE